MNRFLEFFKNFFGALGRTFTGRVLRKPPPPPIENIEPDTVNVEKLPRLRRDLRVLK